MPDAAAAVLGISYLVVTGITMPSVEFSTRTRWMAGSKTGRDANKTDATMRFCFDR